MLKGNQKGVLIQENSKYKDEIECYLPKAVQIPKPVSRYVSDKLGQALSSSLEEEPAAEDIKGRKFIIAFKALF